MKNVHVLPTRKVKRLKISHKEIEHEIFKSELYITFDEEIKEGDWYYLPRTNLAYRCNEDPTELNLERRLGVCKIILTTDQDLINDGVQAIDDEFLEWFVKNPSCMEVEIERGYRGYNLVNYKILIPKEPKQHLIDIMKGDEELGLYEVANELYPINNTGSMFMATRDELNNSYKQKAFIEGAKWQKEQDKRLYSEEEVLKLLLRLQQTESYDNLYEWFEQFKKQ